MANERFISAIEQMERALARIEAVVSSPRSDTPEASAAMAALATRHDNLKNHMAEAIGRIDALLDGHR